MSEDWMRDELLMFKNQLAIMRALYLIQTKHSEELSRQLEQTEARIEEIEHPLRSNPNE